MSNAQRWGYLIEKGKNYWEQGILPAFEGRFPYTTPLWTERDLVGDYTLVTGWARKDEPGKDLPAHWKDAFELIPEGSQAARNQETSFVSLDHNAAFTNTQGDTGMPPTLGQYYAYILPYAGAIITTVTYSPESLLREYGVHPQDMPARLPAVHHTSDVLWLVWQSYQSYLYRPTRFRYFAAEDILNPVTKPLLDDIFLARRGTNNVPWSRRLTFDLRSDEGKALLGSPNGSAVVWMLTHRAAVLGWREVRVSVFNPGGNMRCMIWDLVPFGERAVFGEVEGW